MSVGFHYFEALHQSLALQWLPKDRAPMVLGKIVSGRALASLGAFAFVFLAAKVIDLPVEWVYVAGGAVAMAVGAFCWIAFPEYGAKAEQSKRLVFRNNYWLWYGLVFLSGSRRQIFMVFSNILMVEKFGFSVADMSMMYFVNQSATMVLAPMIGRFIGRVGERRTLIVEYCGLIAVFLAYAYVQTAWIAVGLYILDHVLFAMAIAIKTYFQKIAEPQDIASSTGVSFTISHIVAVVIPAAFGFIWVVDHSYVFLAASGIAMLSLILALMVPRHPDRDRVATVDFPRVQPAGAE
ncbi:MAG: MFS transporter [Rhodospirillaceae bacterium]